MLSFFHTKAAWTGSEGFLRASAPGDQLLNDPPANTADGHQLLAHAAALERLGPACCWSFATTKQVPNALNTSHHHPKRLHTVPETLQKL